MTATDRARELVLAAAAAASEKLATDVVAIDVSEQLVITDAFLLASAPNERQVASIVDAVQEREWTDFLQMQREQLDVLKRIEARLLDNGAATGTTETQ